MVDTHEGSWTDDEVAIEIDPKKVSKLPRHDVHTAKEPIKGKRYNDILRDEYLRINGTPSWVESHIDECNPQKQMPIKVVHGAVAGSKCTELTVKKLYDVNATCNLMSPSQCIKFHPSFNILLTSGRHRHMQLFKLDDDSPKALQSVQIMSFPVRCGNFINDGTEIILSSITRSLYIYDLADNKGYFINRIKGRSEKSWKRFSVSPCGKTMGFVGDEGNTVLLSSKSREVIGALTQGSPLVDIAFSKHCEHLVYTVGAFGDIYTWDLRILKCLKKITNNALIDINCVASSPTGLLALGSRSGYISLLNFSDSTCSSRYGSVVKEFGNLTTRTTSIAFSSTKNLLCFSSDAKSRAVRMVGLNTKSVFTNWPFSNISNAIHRVSGVDFSFNAKYLALSNSDGRILISSIGPE